MVHEKFKDREYKAEIFFITKYFAFFFFALKLLILFNILQFLLKILKKIKLN